MPCNPPCLAENALDHSEGNPPDMLQSSLEILRDPIRVFTGLCWACAVCLTGLLSWLAVQSVQQVRSDEVYVEGLQRQASKAMYLTSTRLDRSR